MTDGTTGIQVAPTAEDMSMAQSVFQKAADAIVGMSQLKVDVDALRQQVTQMQDEMERLRRTNDMLEESLSHSRQVRQELEQKLSAATAAQAQSEQDKASALRDLEHWQSRANDLDAAITVVQRERDDWTTLAKNTEDKLGEAYAKLDKLAEIFGTPKAVQAAPPEPIPAANITAVPEMTPILADPKEIDWDKPYHWDPLKGCYVND